METNMQRSKGNNTRIAKLTFTLTVILAIVSVSAAFDSSASKTNPPAPKPEPVSISELPLPPTAPSSAEGACSTAINPKGTGCIAPYDNRILESPVYMWEGKPLLMPVEFTGPPAGGIYNGHHVLAIKTDGTLF